jgi:molybdopterin-guanine dinucleotide biosynthesis protein A
VLRSNAIEHHHGVMGQMSGAVLTGGTSSRMGRDKGLLLGDVAVGALRAAGIDDVVRIGGVAGDVLDDHPGEGPLGGILTALRRASSADVVVVLACDLPLIDGPTVRAIVEALGPADAVACPPGEPLCGAWRPGLARPVLERLFTEGERSPRRALAGLRVALVDVPDPTRLADADTPGALP